MNQKVLHEVKAYNDRELQEMNVYYAKLNENHLSTIRNRVAILTVIAVLGVIVGLIASA